MIAQCDVLVLIIVQDMKDGDQIWLAVGRFDRSNVTSLLNLVPRKTLWNISLN